MVVSKLSNVSYSNSMSSVFLASIIAFSFNPRAVIVGSEANDEHMAQYVQYTQDYHDNIDDTYHVHQHVHKHSENGEEHEHDHEHRLGVQVEIKTLYSPIVVGVSFPIIDQRVSFIENSLVSDPHPQGIFRPPRS